MEYDYQLSKREQEVAALLLQGKSNKQIALALGISESTVEFHLRNVYVKLRVDNRAGAVKKLLESTGGIPGDSTVDETGKKANIEVSKSKLDLKNENRSSVTRRISLADIIRFLLTHRFPLFLWLLLAFVILFAFIQLNKNAWTYEREGEYPDEYTVGQIIQRSNASAEMVHGQFGTVPAWPPQSGYVKYKNIKTPRADHLFLRLRYSKYSSSSVPILVYLDDETLPRASITPTDQGDWDKFVWTDTIDLGSVERGVHFIKFYTDGQTYGVADLDKFVLTTGPP